MIVEVITKENRKRILGSKSFFSDANSLNAKLIYVNGISALDEILDGKSQKDFNSVIHLIDNPNGLEIELAKTFKSFVFGINKDDINKIVFQNPLSPVVIIESNVNETIIFSFSKEDFESVFAFFYKNYYEKVTISNLEIKQFKSNFEFLNTVKKRSYSKRMNRRTYFTLWLGLSLLYFIIFYIYAFTNIFMYILILVITILHLVSASERFQDFNEKPANALKLLIPFYNIYISFILLTKKGDALGNKYGPNTSLEEPFFI